MWAALDPCGPAGAVLRAEFRKFECSMASNDLVASNDSKEAEATDMKKVILHVFGMT